MRESIRERINKMRDMNRDKTLNISKHEGKEEYCKDCKAMRGRSFFECIIWEKDLYIIVRQFDHERKELKMLISKCKI